MSDEKYIIPFHERIDDKGLFKAACEIANDKIITALKKNADEILNNLNKSQKKLAKKNLTNFDPSSLQFFVRLELEKPNVEKLISDAVLKKLKPMSCEGYDSINKEERTEAFLKQFEPEVKKKMTPTRRTKMKEYIESIEVLFDVSLKDGIDKIIEEANKKHEDEKIKEDLKEAKEELKAARKEKEEANKSLEATKAENEKLESEKEELKRKIQSLTKPETTLPEPQKPLPEETEALETELKKEEAKIDETKEEGEEEDTADISAAEVQDALNDAILIGKLDVSSLSNFLQTEKIMVNVCQNFPKEAWGGNSLPDEVYNKFYLRDNQLSFSQKISSDLIFNVLQIDDYYNLTDDAKRQAILNALNDKALLFGPSIRAGRTPEDKYFSACRILDIKPVSDTRFNNAILIPSTEYHKPGLEKAIQNREPINLIGYDRRLHLSLRYILCDNALYRVNLKPVMGSNTNTLWVSQDQVLQLLSKNFLTDVTEENRFEFINELDTRDLSYYYVPSRAIIALENGTEISTTKSKSVNAIQPLKEKDFIEAFIDKTFENHLAYDQDDLINFHVALKTSQLVILAGASGTGKTQLPLLYAKTFNMNEELGTVLFVPITPSYTEPNDILGYFRPSQSCTDYDGTYIESQTGLVKFLLDAEKNPDRLYMVVFDEMNLSQIEYWFLIGSSYFLPVWAGYFIPALLPPVYIESCL